VDELGGGASGGTYDKCEGGCHRDGEDDEEDGDCSPGAAGAACLAAGQRLQLARTPAPAGYQHLAILPEPIFWSDKHIHFPPARAAPSKIIFFPTHNTPARHASFLALIFTFLSKFYPLTFPLSFPK
jgi:hypothetical protein